jgi:pimeloyl-ACP methyl ester carboxylesterase
MEWTVRTSDGRNLAVEEGGDPAGRPVLAHLGTPNSRHLYGPHVTDAAERGLRLISYDRPGYGDSTPHPGRTVADSASDVRAICEQLGIDRLAMWGISGGGPHVLACAALLPDLVVAAASLASLAPYGADGLDYFAGMGQGNIQVFGLLLKNEAAAGARFEHMWEDAMTATASSIAGTLRSLLTPTDAAVLTGELAEYAAASGRAGLAPGWQGWLDENRVHLSPWGFDMADISVPVLLLHGRHDKFVPFGHGQWLAAHIPGVEARLLEDDGHLTLLQDRVSEVHAWLADHLDQSDQPDHDQPDQPDQLDDLDPSAR